MTEQDPNPADLTPSTRGAARHAGGVPFQPDDPVMKSPYAHGAFVFATLPSEWGTRPQ